MLKYPRFVEFFTSSLANDYIISKQRELRNQIIFTHVYTGISLECTVLNLSPYPLSMLNSFFYNLLLSIKSLFLEMKNFHASY